MKQINVLICENKPIYAEALRVLLDTYDDIHVIDAICGGELSMNALNTLAPSIDVILLDHKMPDISGLYVIQRIKDVHPDIPILVFSSQDAVENITEVIHAGASGYLLKDKNPSELVKAIRGTCRGEFHLDPVIAGGFIKYARKQPAKCIPPNLTERDIVLLTYLTKGLSNREIGNRLHLSEGTVKNYTSQLFTKISVKDRLQAVIKAITYGIVEVPC